MIELYENAEKVTSSPSLTEVINKKGFLLLSGTDETRWGSSDGLLKLCTEDINPNTEVPQPQTDPCSLLSFNGYAHFYKVMPYGFVQNSDGRPDDYTDYGLSIYSEVDDTAYKVVELGAEGSSGDSTSITTYFPFTFMPACYNYQTTSGFGSNVSWLTASKTTAGVPMLVCLSNSATSERKGYAYYDYVAPATGTDRDRRFGVYVCQSGTSTSGGGSTYSSFLLYATSGGATLDENSDENPYYLTLVGATTSFIIGGGGSLVSVTTDDMNNMSIGVAWQSVSSSSSGIIGYLNLTLPDSPSNSKVEITIKNSSNSTKSFVFAYIVGN